MKRKKTFKMLVLLFTMCTIFVLSGCDISFNNNSEYVSVSGKVVFEEAGLKDVTIKSKYKQFCKTNENGEFNFNTTQTNVEIFAEKEGYSFTGSFILTENTSDVLFIASRVKNLDGELRLKSITITPIAIISLYNENYEYLNLGAKSLKSGLFEVNINSVNVLNISEITYFEKNKDTILNITDEHKFAVDENTNLTLNFKLNAYVKYNLEEELINDNYITLIKNNLKTNIVRDNKLEFNLFGINSKTGGYTYNICFTFDYITN